MLDWSVWMTSRVYRVNELVCFGSNGRVLARSGSTKDDEIDRGGQKLVEGKRSSISYTIPRSVNILIQNGRYGPTLCFYQIEIEIAWLRLLLEAFPQFP